MKGFLQNIEGITVKDDEFRRVFYTSKHCQLVVMLLRPTEEVWAERQAWSNQTPSMGAR